MSENREVGKALGSSKSNPSPEDPDDEGWDQEN